MCSYHLFEDSTTNPLISIHVKAGKVMFLSSCIFDLGYLYLLCRCGPFSPHSFRPFLLLFKYHVVLLARPISTELVQPIFDVLIIDSLNRLYKEDTEYTVIWHELLYLHDSLFKRGSVA